MENWKTLVGRAQESRRSRRYHLLIAPAVRGAGLDLDWGLLCLALVDGRAAAIQEDRTHDSGNGSWHLFLLAFVLSL